MLIVPTSNINAGTEKQIKFDKSFLAGGCNSTFSHTFYRQTEAYCFTSIYVLRRHIGNLHLNLEP